MHKRDWQKLKPNWVRNKGFINNYIAKVLGVFHLTLFYFTEVMRCSFLTIKYNLFIISYLMVFKTMLKHIFNLHTDLLLFLLNKLK